MKLSLAFPIVLAVLSFAATNPEDKPAKPKGATPAKVDEHPIDAPDVADIPTQDLRLSKDENKRYLLAGPRTNEKQPKAGFGLLVVLPGGDGSADFHPFVKRIYKHAVPDGFLVVQPVATKWTEDQQIVWPTEKAKTKGMKFTTEDFVESVIEAVAKTNKIDPARVELLAWSSSGPVAYILSTRPKHLVRGSLIAMSVFHPSDLELPLTKNRAYYLLHSPDDKICPFKMAEEACDTLKKHGAKVEFATYEGGHGWSGNVFGNIRTGLEYLLDPKESLKKAGKSAK